jgi:phosphoribosylaminoimidazolecarboxamide formyltransferase/IMP cyclohydrolase
VLDAYQHALQCDPVSAFGGIVTVNGTINAALAKELTDLFLEVIIARSVDEDAKQIFGKKKNLRVVTLPEEHWEAQHQSLLGLYSGDTLLLQESDCCFPELDQLEIVSKRQPTDSEREACLMGWKVAKHVKSNAIVISNEKGTVGIGAGQMSRVDSSRIAVQKAQDAGFSLKGSIAASDAFFPFPDGVLELAKSGITAIIQPGGSIRDQKVIDAADEANVVMVFTGRRHFRHI